MGTAMRELRTAVMILVDATWDDREGTSHKVSARMEDKSAGGACLRVKAPVEVGAMLTIRWRFEEFSGICKYCRCEGREYVIGIQRDGTKRLDAKTLGAKVPGPSPASSSQAPKVVGSPIWADQLHAETAGRTNQPSISIVAPAPLKLEGAPVVLASNREAAAAVRQPEAGITARREGLTLRRQAQLRMKPPANRKELRRERKPMGRSWLERAPWSHKQESAGIGVEPNGEKNNSSGKEYTDVTASLPPVHHSVAEEKGTSFEVDLLPMEEIYRAAGVVSPQKGYSVHKVVEMLHSEHIRGLSPDLKRAAVLMALDAAGVSVAQIQQDAKRRQQALDHYEAEQSKQAEAEWSRRAEENAQIEAELERVKAHYMARITRNLEGVAREKSTFNHWLKQKKQEAEKMAEAVDLCLMTPVSKPGNAAMAAAAAVGAGPKPA
jgi:hypothetical protein